jgi:hypothetical protein
MPWHSNAGITRKMLVQNNLLFRLTVLTAQGVSKCLRPLVHDLRNAAIFVTPLPHLYKEFSLSAGGAERTLPRRQL